MSRENNIDLFIDEEEIGALVSIVSESTEDNKIKWSDLSSNISTREWGKMIEYGIINPCGERVYKLNDKKKIKEKIKSSGFDNIEDAKFEDEMLEKNVSFEFLDKLVGLITVVGFLGFGVSSIRWGIYNTLNIFLNPITGAYPFYITAIFIAFITSCWAVYARSIILDSDPSKYTEKMSELRDDDSIFGVPDNATPKQKEKIMRLQDNMLKSQVKPIIWSSSIVIPFIVWLRTELYYASIQEPIILPMFGRSLWRNGLIGPFATWIAWYLITSFTIGKIVGYIYDHYDIYLSE